ncbi:heterokaryon incompatibility protein-domain-containing protein [Podospora aff. communis PSN243]|uniref:Heterokaryon incompatibility protein-domain-containing protein n=1 Tax=Podospora aff. communis PSN243 TaxID=3040156 RepID=A0AAV9G5D7_9PEZI|nr:heterokaryon incompatibility protein-domain-containing protein [Podospora aff. communis PSN243]
MRLLNTETLQLKEFVEDSSQLRYAILSHRWGEEEISFQDITTRNPRTRTKKGYGKIENCCAQARNSGLEWVWIDTCCIDKSSSSELSEAINSMYRWYQTAAICYAYLADVTYLPFDIEKTVEAFRESEWFSRGWTLQELVAPRNLRFFDKTWANFGTKRSFGNEIFEITGIPIDVLAGFEPPQTRSVAERMSWAAWRQTTRVEDAAYCLLGIFEVNMPLLYGEGRRAFQRLQHEILKQEEDYTILAWLSFLKAGLPSGGGVYFGGREERFDNSTSILSSSANDFLFVGNSAQDGDAHLSKLLEEKPFEVSGLQSLSIGARRRGHHNDGLDWLPELLGLTPENTPPPPVVTSRGLKATLFVWQQGDRLLAWTNCYYIANQDSPEKALLFCIEIKLMRSSSLVFQRTDTSAELHGLDAWPSFKPMDLYLSLDWEKPFGVANHYFDGQGVRWGIPDKVAIYLNKACPGSIQVYGPPLKGRNPDLCQYPAEAAEPLFCFSQDIQEPIPVRLTRTDSKHISHLAERSAMYAIRWTWEDYDLMFGVIVSSIWEKYGGVWCRLLAPEHLPRLSVGPESWKETGEVPAHLFASAHAGTPVQWGLGPMPDRYSVQISKDTMAVVNVCVRHFENSGVSSDVLFLEVIIERAMEPTPQRPKSELKGLERSGGQERKKKDRGISRYFGAFLAGPEVS